MIEVDGVCKSFGTRHAVRDLTVSFPAGTVTCLLGLNGAGKTTLLRLIAGLETPDSGTVRVDGTRLSERQDPLRSLGVALGAMDPGHTVVRHLRWLAALGGIPAGRVDEVLDEVRLGDRRSERIGALSTGARQRLSIGSTLLGDPRVYLFDEPLNGLDVPGIVWMRDLLRRLADAGRTVVMASHLLSEVVLTADRVTMLSAGHIVTDGAIDDVVPSGHDPREYLEDSLIGATC